MGVYVGLTREGVHLLSMQARYGHESCEARADKNIKVHIHEVYRLFLIACIVGIRCSNQMTLGVTANLMISLALTWLIPPT